MGTRKLAEYIIDLVLLLVGIALAVASQSIPPGSSIGIGGDFMPKVCTKIWIFISLCLLLWEKFTPDDHQKGITADLKCLGLTALALFLYIALLDTLGFVLSSILYMAAQMLIFIPLENRNRKHYIIIGVLALVVPLLINEVFEEVFSLLLPAGILF